MLPQFSGGGDQQALHHLVHAPQLRRPSALWTRPTPRWCWPTCYSHFLRC